MFLKGSWSWVFWRPAGGTWPAGMSLFCHRLRSRGPSSSSKPSSFCLLRCFRVDHPASGFSIGMPEERDNLSASTSLSTFHSLDPQIDRLPADPAQSAPTAVGPPAICGDIHALAVRKCPRCPGTRPEWIGDKTCCQFCCNAHPKTKFVRPPKGLFLQRLLSFLRFNSNSLRVQRQLSAGAH
jgi:hypothetical protein